MLDQARPLTHTQILNFRCPFRYQQIHLLGQRDTSDPARRGSTIHHANHLYVEALVQRREMSDPDEARLALHQAIVDEQTPAHLVPEVEDLWLDWVERFELDLDGFLLAEERRTVDARFSFKPDLAFARSDALDIEDLKTHYQGLTEAAAKKDLQARMYAFLASRTWPGFPAYRFTFRFLRLHYAVTVTFSPAELDAIERQLAALEAGVREAEATETFPASPGEACGYCHLACPLVEDAARLPVRLTTREEAERTAGELLVLQQAATAKRKALEMYAALNGAVTAGGVEWAHRRYESSSYGAARAIEVLRQHGVDAAGDPSLTFGKTALRRYLSTKKFAFVRPDLEGIVEIRVQTRFAAKKIGSVGEDDEG